MTTQTYTYESYNGTEPVTTSVEIPTAIIEQASAAAYNEDRLMVVGHHPYFGWVYRDAEDEGALAELTLRIHCDASGLVE
jgi:hypothetical protein